MNVNHHVYIIAEAGVNHNGSIELAKALIDKAVEAKADAIKFQTFKAKNIIKNDVEKVPYQLKTTAKDETQYQMLKKLELSIEEHQILIDHSQKKGIQLLSTPFDIDSLNLLVHRFRLPFLKISSGDITDAPLLLMAAQSQLPIILSTGMSTLGEVEKALSVLAYGYLSAEAPSSIQDFENAYHSIDGQKRLREKITLLHCTSEYPAPYTDINLLAMDTLRKSFGLQVGYSDHSIGISIPIAAVARGASIIEKHFTIDKNLPGPDHQASLEPAQLKEMILSIRDVEQALGSPIKAPSLSEIKNRMLVRKSLVVAKPVNKGEIFSKDNLTCKRPEFGISPFEYWNWIGRKAKKVYQQDEEVE